MLEQISDFTNLVPAHKQALRAVHSPRQRAYHLATQERLILELQRDLADGSYAPQPPRQFCVYEPKRRLITAPNFRDRVAHHAICRVIEPLFEARMHPQSYACRVGKGTHRAIGRCQELMREYPYVLKGDVHQFFASIGHARLLAMLEEAVSDPAVRTYCRRIIGAYATEGRPGVGLPIGNLTSQLFANVYLTPFDWFAERIVGGGSAQGNLVRYMDDWLLFGEDKGELWEVARELRRFLRDELALEWPDAKRSLTPCRAGIPFLGQFITPTSRRLDRRTKLRAYRRLRGTGRQRQAGPLPKGALQQAAATWRALALPTQRGGFLRHGYSFLMARP